VTEFTGERVIPGHVNQDLWNEHYSRYAFAARFAAGRDVLDVGCGAGYGTAELARGARAVTGLDLAADAGNYAQSRYGLHSVQFVRGSAASLPFRAGEFQLVTAFEVIEHLSEWRQAIQEAARVLTADGVFLVSTPNTLDYADSRKIEGPNPYHHHEFEFEEFGTALAETFPHATVLLQNRTECQLFYPHKSFWPAEARVDAGAGTPAEANFFVAICSRRPLRDLHAFAYVPRAANVLREREQHIAKLEQHLALLEGQLSEARGERDLVLEKHREQTEHLEKQNHWALELEEQLRAAQARIVELQEQFAAEQTAGLEVAGSYEEKIRELEEDVRAKAEWALQTERRLTAEIESERAERAAVLERLKAAEATAEERARWALESNQRLERIEGQLELVRASRWVLLGRKLGVGPRL
jgi:SAM-dependent methyltransferase